MSFDLPHMLLMQQSYEKGLAEGRVRTKQEIYDFIIKLHPTLGWLAESIKHGEFE